MNPLEEATIQELVDAIEKRARSVVVLLGGVKTNDVNQTWSSYKNGLHAECIGMAESFAFDMKMKSFNGTHNDPDDAPE